MSGLNFNINDIMGIVADVVIVLIFLILVIVGGKKGFVKMAKGFVASVAVLVLATMTFVPLTGIITANTQWDERLADALQPAIESRLTEPHTVITTYDFGDGPELAFLDEDGVHQPYEDIFNGNVLFTSLNVQKLIKPAVESALKTQENVYLIKAITSSLANLIMLGATLIIFIIVARILVAIIFALLKKLAASLYIMHFVNKLLGVVFGIGAGLLVILVLLTVFKVLEDFAFMAPVNEVMSRSYIASFISKYNYLYVLLIRFVDIKAFLSKIKIPG